MEENTMQSKKVFNVGDYVIIDTYAGIFTVSGEYRVIAKNCTGCISSITGDIAYVLWDSDQFFELEIQHTTLSSSIKFDNPFVAAINFDYIVLDKKRTREDKLDKLGIS